MLEKSRELANAHWTNIATPRLYTTVNTLTIAPIQTSLFTNNPSGYALVTLGYQNVAAPLPIPYVHTHPHYR